MSGFWKEVQQSVRSLLANRRFAAVGLTILAVTIAGVTLVITLVHSVLLKPLPYPDPDPDRLVVLWERQPNLPMLRTVRTADFMDWRSRSYSFESMALYRPFVYDIDVDTAPIRVQVWSVSPEIFSILGADTVIGRTLGVDDGLPGLPATAVIGYELWQSRFGGSPDVLGKTLQFPQNASVTIVGVLAPRFRLPTVGTMVLQARMPNPAPPFPEIWQAYRPSGQDLTNRLRGSYIAVARLKAGVSTETANDEIAAIQKQLAAEYPDTNGGVNAGANPLIDEVVGSYQFGIVDLFRGCCLLVVDRTRESYQSSTGSKLCSRAGTFDSSGLGRNAGKDSSSTHRRACDAKHIRLRSGFDRSGRGHSDAAAISTHRLPSIV